MNLKPKPLEILEGSKPKWVSEVEKKHNVKIEINWIDKIRHDIDKSIKNLLVDLLIGYIKNKIRGSEMLEWLDGKKTFITIILTALFNLGVSFGWWTPETDWIVVLNTILISLGVGFLRAGVKKSAPK